MFLNLDISRWSLLELKDISSSGEEDRSEDNIFKVDIESVKPPGKKLMLTLPERFRI